MKFTNLISIMACAFIVQTAMGQELSLPVPSKEYGCDFGNAVADRHSTRSFDSNKQLSEQQISDMLWSAAGVNRSNGYRTNPTAMNRQEIDVYVFTKDGVYLYIPASNSLREVAKGDHRKLVAAKQAFAASAPVSLVLIANVDKLGDMNQRNMMMAAVDAGIVCQNINLFCSANGLATVPRASMDADGIKKLLNLSDTQIPVMNNPVGYAAE